MHIMHWVEKQYNNALDDFDKALEIEPNDAYALKRRKAIYEKLKHLNRSLESKPNNSNALHRDREGSADELEDNNSATT